MPQWYKSLPFEQEVAYGYDLYLNCYNASLEMLVLGDMSIRRDKKLIVNLGTTSVTPSSNANVIKTSDRNRINRGSVLNERYWWPFFNDCWVMGGVHGKHEFHLGNTDWPENDQLWDKKFSRPKMLGRELLILSISGYTVRKSPLGMVFYNTDHMKTFGLRLTNIYSLKAPTEESAFIKYIKQSF